MVHLSLEVGRKGLATFGRPNEPTLLHAVFDVVANAVAAVIALVRRGWESACAAEWARRVLTTLQLLKDLHRERETE